MALLASVTDPTADHPRTHESAFTIEDFARPLAASLDVLDYLKGLEEALAAHLPPALRRPAVRDARRVLETLAFRFALLDERPLPEDLDYLRAIEAMKPPARAAEVLARRKGYYAKNRRRRLITTWSILAFLAFAIGGLAYLATSEKADTVASLNEHPFVNVNYTRYDNFTLAPGVTRLHVSADVFVTKGSRGEIEIILIDPSGKVALREAFGTQSNNYLRKNVDAPAAGAWTFFVTYSEAHGSAAVTVDAITPTR